MLPSKKKAALKRERKKKFKLSGVNMPGPPERGSGLCLSPMANKIRLPDLPQSFFTEEMVRQGKLAL
jgi:hypothetical protein